MEFKNPRRCQIVTKLAPLVKKRFRTTVSYQKNNRDYDTNN